MENQQPFPSTLDQERTFSLDQASSSLSPDAFKRFVNGKYTAKLSLFAGKTLQVFTVKNNQPHPTATIKCADAYFNLDDGIVIDLDVDDGQAIHHVEVSHEPVEVVPGVFLWSPRYSMVERYLHQGVYLSRVSIAIRTASGPARALVEGAAYCLDARNFAMLTNAA